MNTTHEVKLRCTAEQLQALADLVCDVAADNPAHPLYDLFWGDLTDELSRIEDEGERISLLRNSLD